MDLISYHLPCNKWQSVYISPTFNHHHFAPACSTPANTKHIHLHAHSYFVSSRP